MGGGCSQIYFNCSSHLHKYAEDVNESNEIASLPGATPHYLVLVCSFSSASCDDDTANV